jgi:hypothetical protein
MSNSKSAYLQNKTLNHVLRGDVVGTSFTPPTGIWIALFIGDPDDSGVEVSGAGYARRQVTFASPSNRKASNGVDTVLPRSVGAWTGSSDITHFALMDAQSGGTRFYTAAISDAIAVPAANRKIEFEVGSITVQES